MLFIFAKEIFRMINLEEDHRRIVHTLILLSILMTYYIWNVPTRILFVKTYRDIMSRVNGSMDEIILILKVPLILMIVFRGILVIVRLIPVVSSSSGYKAWWTYGRDSWGYCALD